MLMDNANNANSYQRIGNFKVIGNPNLFGGMQLGDVFFKNGTVKNIMVSYDTYRQQLTIHSGAEEQALIDQLEQLDSFTLKANDTTFYNTDQKFMSASQFDSTKFVYVQRIVIGPRFTLYKAYQSSLSIVTTNYAQADLRQFDLNYEYYYTDVKNPGFNSLKANSKGVKKEFNEVENISNIVEAAGFRFNGHPEPSLVKVFNEMR